MNRIESKFKYDECQIILILNARTRFVIVFGPIKMQVKADNIQKRQQLDKQRATQLT